MSNLTSSTRDVQFGTGGFQYRTVMDVFHLDPASFARLLTEWKAFSVNLGFSGSEVADLEERLSLQQVSGEDIILEIFMIWKCDHHHHHANLKVLFEALYVMGYQGFAESIKRKFHSSHSNPWCEFPEPMMVDDIAPIVEDPQNMTEPMELDDRNNPR